MLNEYPGFPLCLVLSRLAQMEQWLKPVRTSNLSGPDVEYIFRDLVIALEVECKRLDLTGAVAIAETMHERLDSGSPAAVIAFQYLTPIREQIDKALKHRTFLFVPENEVRFRDKLMAFAHKVGALSGDRSAMRDLEEACNCYIFNCSTACVFHLMRSVERALRLLGERLKVSLKHDLEVEDWRVIVTAINCRIRELHNDERSIARASQLAFYSELGITLGYFKDAWRNHVAHDRIFYDKSEAERIMVHTQALWEQLSRAFLKS